MTDISAPTWYDGLLIAMPTSIAGGAVAGWLLTIPFVLGVGVGSGLAWLLVTVSLFAVPPQ